MPEITADVDSAKVVPDDSSIAGTHALSMSHCSNCRARLHENTICPRCGTDLSLPLQIVQEAKDLERLAVAYSLDREWSRAKAALVRVQRLYRSDFSRQLLAFVDDQIVISRKSPEEKSPEGDSLSAEIVVEDDSLATMDLAEIERYG